MLRRAASYPRVPAAGESVEAGSEVGITVSDGPEKLRIPDVAGQDLTTAQQNIYNAGFAYTSVEVQSDEPAGKVISTDPAAGTMLDPWAREVTINYSSGPAPEPAPAPQQPAAQQPAPQQPAVQQPAVQQPSSPQPAPQSNADDSEKDNQKAQEKAREAQQKAREGARKAQQKANEN